MTFSFHPIRDLRGSITMDETHAHFAGEFGGHEQSASGAAKQSSRLGSKAYEKGALLHGSVFASPLIEKAGKLSYKAADASSKAASLWHDKRPATEESTKQAHVAAARAHSSAARAWEKAEGANKYSEAHKELAKFHSNAAKGE